MEISEDKMFRQVTLLIPVKLYARIEKCHAESQKCIPGTPTSEVSFMDALLWDGMHSTERLLAKIKEQNSLIVTPEINVDPNKIRQT